MQVRSRADLGTELPHTTSHPQTPSKQRAKSEQPSSGPAGGREQGGGRPLCSARIRHAAAALQAASAGALTDPRTYVAEQRGALLRKGPAPATRDADSRSRATRPARPGPDRPIRCLPCPPPPIPLPSAPLLLSRFTKSPGAPGAPEPPFRSNQALGEERTVRSLPGLRPCTLHSVRALLPRLRDEDRRGSFGDAATAVWGGIWGPQQDAAVCVCVPCAAPWRSCTGALAYWRTGVRPSLSSTTQTNTSEDTPAPPAPHAPERVIGGRSRARRGRTDRQRRGIAGGRVCGGGAARTAAVAPVAGAGRRSRMPYAHPTARSGIAVVAGVSDAVAVRRAVPAACTPRDTAVRARHAQSRPYGGVVYCLPRRLRRRKRAHGGGPAARCAKKPMTPAFRIARRRASCHARLRWL